MAKRYIQLPSNVTPEQAVQIKQQFAMVPCRAGCGRKVRPVEAQARHGMCPMCYEINLHNAMKHRPLVVQVPRNFKR